jgi:hypothetical protein
MLDNGSRLLADPRRLVGDHLARSRNSHRRPRRAPVRHSEGSQSGHAAHPGQGAERHDSLKRAFSHVNHLCFV